MQTVPGKEKRRMRRQGRLTPMTLLGCVWLMAGMAQAGEAGSAPIIAEGAVLARAGSGYSFTEGPAADADGNVYFTDQPNDRILKWSADGGVSLFMQGAGRANGLYFDHQGGLVACADEKNLLLRISPERVVEVLLAGFEGRKFNGPNDAWVAPDGGIYFTDPFYQRDWWARTEPDLDSENVYLLAPNGAVSVADGDLVKPNGIIGTPAGDRLYVADIGAGITWVYDRDEDGRLLNKRQFAAMGSDGMTVDDRGNVYLTGDGVTVFNPDGERIAKIAVDEDWTANVTFGGRERNILFITAMGSVYTLEMAVTGVH
jgi:gluconolactonase